MRRFSPTRDTIYIRTECCIQFVDSVASRFGRTYPWVRVDRRAVEGFGRTCLVSKGV